MRLLAFVASCMLFNLELFAGSSCNDTWLVKPTWNFPVPISAEQSNLVVDAHEVAKPEIVYSSQIKGISAPLKAKILEAVARTFVFLPPALQSILPSVIHIDLADAGTGASVWVAKETMYIPEQWLKPGVSDHEVLTTVAHELGHIIYTYFVADVFVHQLSLPYELNSKNEMAQMLRPFGEVFADMMSVIATGRSDAVSSIMPRDSFDFRVRDFAALLGYQALYLDFLLDQPEGRNCEDEHTKSYLRQVIWSHVLKAELPYVSPEETPEYEWQSQLAILRKALSKQQPDIRSMQQAIMRVLNALTPVRWYDIYINYPEVPGLKALAATLALVTENEEIRLETLTSAILKAVQNETLNLDKFISSSLTNQVIAETIAHSPALIKQLTGRTDEAALSGYLKMSLASTDHKTVETYERHLRYVQSGGVVNLKEEIAAAELVTYKVVTKTVSGEPVTIVLREHQPGYVDVISESHVIEDYDDLEADAEEEISQSTKVTVRVRADGSTYEVRD